MMPRTLLTTLLAAFLTVPALGQSGGSGIDASILSATGALNAAQKTSVSSYAARSVEAIKSGTDQKAIDDARTALVKPSRDPGATPAFRKAYGVILVTELAPIAKGSDLRRAVVASHAQKDQQTAIDARRFPPLDAHLGAGDPLNHRNHGRSRITD